MAWCCVVGTQVLLLQYTGQQSAHTDMSKAHPLLLHPHLLSSLVGPRGQPNKVDFSELKLTGSLSFTHTFTETATSKKQANLNTLPRLLFWRFCALLLKSGKKMTSTMAAHPDQHPGDLVLHLDLHPQMMMMKNKFMWQVGTVLWTCCCFIFSYIDLSFFYHVCMCNISWWLL